MDFSFTKKQTGKISIYDDDEFSQWLHWIARER